MCKTPFTTGVSALLLLLLLLSVSPSTAEIKALTITSDTRPMILLEKFGFTHTGRVSISVSSVFVVASGGPQPDPSRLGFFLLSEESLLQVLIEIQQNPSFCVLDSRYTMHLFTFRDLSPYPSASANHSYPVTFSDEYSLFFANCAPETSVSMEIHTELFNLNRDASRNYLSSSHTNLPSLLFLFSFAYFSFLLAFYLRHVTKLSLHRIHLLMAALLLMKALNLLSAAEDKHYVKLTGTPHGWDVLFFIFDFIHVVLLFTVIVLVGTRWTFLHPLSQERGNRALLKVIPLQILAKIASVVIHKTGPYMENWVTLNQIFLLLDFMSCCVVFSLIFWSVRSIRDIISKNEGDGDHMNLYYKFSLIKRFYLLVIGYLLFTRFGMFAFKTVLSYEYQWVSNLVEETANLVFCIVVMFYVVGLVENDEYSVTVTAEEKEYESTKLEL